MTDAPCCDDVLDALSDPVRRRVLDYLDRVGAATTGALAVRVDAGPTALYHAHLPTLADANCVRCTDEQALDDRVVSITRIGSEAVAVVENVPDRYDC